MSAPRCLRLLFGGRQGAGKTCLASALAGQPLVWSPGRGPKPAQASWKRAGMAFTALELPGFGVEGQGEPRRQELQAGALAGADLLVLAAPAPEEAWGLEAGWLAGALAAALGFPVLVCATRIDLLGSPRDWEPEALERELASICRKTARRIEGIVVACHIGREINAVGKLRHEPAGKRRVARHRDRAASRREIGKKIRIFPHQLAENAAVGPSLPFLHQEGDQLRDRENTENDAQQEGQQDPDIV